MTPNNQTQNEINSLKAEIERLKNQEDRLIRNFEEDQENQKILNRHRIERLQQTLNTALPDTNHITKYGMFYYKNPNWMGCDEFALCQKDTLIIDKYQLGVQIYPLPDEYKLKIPIIIMAIFDYNHKFRHFGICNRQFKEANTFHSKADSVCVGENEAVTKMATYDNPDTISKAFDEVKSTLETVNPESYLCTTVPTKLRNTKRFIDNKNSEYQNSRHSQNDENNEEEEICSRCQNNMLNCECDRCALCEQFADECECDICEDCGRLSDECECEYCRLCHRRITSTHYEECICDRCDKCRHIKERCDCQNNQTQTNGGQ